MNTPVTPAPGRIIPPQGGSATAKEASWSGTLPRCTMLNLGPGFDTLLSHDSAKRISRIGVVCKESYSQDKEDKYIVEVRYLQPSGYEAVIESENMGSRDAARKLVESTVNLLRQTADWFC